MQFKRNRSYLLFIAFLIGFGITSLVGLPALIIAQPTTLTLIGVGLIWLLVPMLRRLYAV